MTDKKSQLELFKESARQLEADDHKCLEERLQKILRQGPKGEPDG